MSALISFIQAHPTTSALIAFWVGSAAVGSLPAPTATSSPFYVWAFKFLNTMASNITRAYASKVEKSPNFQDAVALQQQSGAQVPKNQP